MDKVWVAVEIMEGEKIKKKRENGMAKNKRIKEKENRRVKNKKKIGGVLRPFHPLIYITRLGEVVFPNVFPKQIQLLDKIRSTSTATAGAATAGALPNAP
jgi:hypothetical protein